MRVAKLAQCPPPVVDPDAKVLDAVRVMERANAGAACVLDRSALVGVISERDIMLRVVGARRDPETTTVRDVMTRSVKTVTPDCSADEALTVMVANHIRHVILVDEKGAVIGLASARNLFPAHVASLDDQLQTLESFVGNDGHGG